MERLLTSRVDPLASVLDSHAAKDYPQSYAALHESFMHMFMTGDALAAAIVGQFPDRYAP